MADMVRQQLSDGQWQGLKHFFAPSDVQSALAKTFWQ
jgi:hypothetical protein